MVDPTCDLAIKMTRIFQEHKEMKSVGFPVFTRKEKIPFGVLRVAVSENEI